MKKKKTHLMRSFVIVAAAVGLLSTVVFGTELGLAGSLSGSSSPPTGGYPSQMSGHPSQGMQGPGTPLAQTSFVDMWPSIPSQSQAPSSESQSLPQEQPSQSAADSSSKPAGKPGKGKRTVYLTFDDGPSPCTPQVLKILKKNDIKATFFVIHSPDEDYYRQIVAGGNTLALHSYTHKYDKIYISDEAFFQDLNKLSDYVKGITGVESKITRFPGGGGNTVSCKYSKGIMTRLVQTLTDKGYHYFDWNASSGDASSVRYTPEQILKNVKQSSYSNGSPKPFIVLLMHDCYDRQPTVDALQSIIDYYKSLDYDFEPITMNTPTIHQPVLN